MHAPYWPSAIRIQPVPPYTDFVQPNKYQSLRYYTDSVHSLITPQRTTQPTGSSYINIQHTKLLPLFYHLAVKYWSHSCKIYFQFCAKITCNRWFSILRRQNLTICIRDHLWLSWTDTVMQQRSSSAPSEKIPLIKCCLMHICLLPMPILPPINYVFLAIFRRGQWSKSKCNWKRNLSINEKGFPVCNAKGNRSIAAKDEEK